MPPPTVTQHMTYIQEKLNPVMEAMVTAMLLKVPEKPEEFMLTWLLEQETYDRGEYGRGGADNPQELADLKLKLEKLKQEKTQLEAALKEAQKR
mmetsp:Transcript_36099/g.84613  ORF Transcript_36099/g.84613 Transcript_36099/m.84613 type:complete len:94 (+) Transcript_36099:176-457(+)|eukprot:CAMPEP_0178453904 /NCGR_PEP_ID=MMETSP0689_2-20121128/45059_1 /TAXON_ID=160604 /ORGANISM="Amphidinium massartii, Strain CS-259" /LENGTH=93 /DNA_ID=CAMNT_0020079773 /DNA_START=176 /DNA_END=457 /DNA_ORIENTATION=+